MSKRITNDDLASVVCRVAAIATEIGVIDTDAEVILEHGSKSNGIAYRIMVRGSSFGPRSAFPLVSAGHLGMTKAGAWQKLADLAYAMEAMERIQRQAA